MATVSIVIPVYNVEKYIIRCLDSVFFQTYKDLEVILVDDCGSDNSIRLAQSYIAEKKLKKWRIVSHEKNKGLSAARNTGLLASQGAYIYFLDSDDTITKDCIDDLVEQMDEDSDFVMSIFENVPAQATFQNFGRGKLSQQELIRKYCRKELPWNAVNRLIRREFLMNNSLFFYVGILSEDLLWNFLLLAYTDKVILVDKITYHYYINQNSIMNSCNYNYKYAEDLFQIEKQMRIILKKNPIDELIKYYHIVKYDIMVQAILWHHYPFIFKWKSLRRIFYNRFSAFYNELPMSKKCIFLLPNSFLVLSSMMRFWYGEYRQVVLGKLRGMLGKVH